MLKTLLTLVVIALAAAAGYAAWYLGTPVRIRQYPIEVEIPRGAGFRAALEQLEKSGVAVRRHEFELLARAMGKLRQIKAGSYEITQPLTPLQLLDKLTRGDVTQAEVRLIEGWTFAQFRAALDASPFLKHDTAGLSDTQILERLRATETHPEGLFFPDTYLFGKGSSDLRVLRRSYLAMQRHLKEEWDRERELTDEDPDQVPGHGSDRDDDGGIGHGVVVEERLAERLAIEQGGTTRPREHPDHRRNRTLLIRFIGGGDRLRQRFAVSRHRAGVDKRLQMPLRAGDVRGGLLRDGRPLIQQTNLNFTHRQRGAGACAHQVGVALIKAVQFNSLNTIDGIKRLITGIDGVNAHAADGQQQQRHADKQRK